MSNPPLIFHCKSYYFFISIAFWSSSFTSWFKEALGYTFGTFSSIIDSSDCLVSAEISVEAITCEFSLRLSSFSSLMFSA